MKPEKLSNIVKFPSPKPLEWWQLETKYVSKKPKRPRKS